MTSSGYPSAEGAEGFKTMSSFKVKLVTYFVLLALVPLAAAYWGFRSIAVRSAVRPAAARLTAECGRARPRTTPAPGAREPMTVARDGVRYRAVAAPPLEILTPQARIDAAESRTENRLLLLLLGSLLLVGIVAWLEGRTIVRSVRRLVG